MEGGSQGFESIGELNPLATDFNPVHKEVEEVKNPLKADAQEYNPEVIIESYETQEISHVKSAQKFEGKYGNINFILGDSLITYDCLEDSWVNYGK